jgi:hypothetical protein
MASFLIRPSHSQGIQIQVQQYGQSSATTVVNLGIIPVKQVQGHVRFGNSAAKLL